MDRFQLLDALTQNPEISQKSLAKISSLSVESGYVPDWLGIFRHEQPALGCGCIYYWSRIVSKKRKRYIIFAVFIMAGAVLTVVVDKKEPVLSNQAA